MTPPHRQVRLRRRPQGAIAEDCFELAAGPTRGAEDGEVVVRNTFLSVDPYMRGRMDDVPSYLPPFAIGEPLTGGAVGEVIESRSPALSPGDAVRHELGWREIAIADAGAFTKIDLATAPASAYLGPLGVPGLTAYLGLLEIAEMSAGDTVFVSGGAGAVGSIVCQIARLRGAARVIASAGSAAKLEYLRDEVGVDVAIDYAAGPIREQLRAAAPDGIDVYFDSVGGEQLIAAIEAIRPHGRIALCGAISGYDAASPPTVAIDTMLLVRKRVAMRGFIVGDHFGRREAVAAEIATWLRSGALSFRETFVDGIERMPAGFIGLLRGDNIGKMLIRLPAGD